MGTSNIFSDSEDFSQNSFTDRNEKPMLDKKKLKKTTPNQAKEVKPLKKKIQEEKKKTKKPRVLPKRTAKKKT